MAKENMNTLNNTGVTDIDLSVTAKKKFRINGDNSKILELNTSDISILNRLQETYPKLQELAQEASEKWSAADSVDSEDEAFFDDDRVKDALAALDEVDKKMREALDYIFDSNVSEICAPSGSMYDPFGGDFRFNHIIDTLASLYESNLEKEMAQMKKNVAKHANKYTKKYAKKK